jgi:hypothetical protein
LPRKWAASRKRRWRIWSRDEQAGDIVAVWIGVALALVALFNVYPQTANYSSPFAFLGVVALVVTLWRVNKAKAHAWNRIVYGRIHVKHLFLISAIFGILPWIWIAVFLPRMNDNINRAILLVVAPALLMFLVASILFGAAVYFVLTGKKDAMRELDRV